MNKQVHYLVTQGRFNEPIAAQFVFDARNQKTIMAEFGLSKKRQTTEDLIWDGLTKLAQENSDVINDLQGTRWILSKSVDSSRPLGAVQLPHPQKLLQLGISDDFDTPSLESPLSDSGDFYDAFGSAPSGPSGGGHNPQQQAHKAGLLYKNLFKSIAAHLQLDYETSEYFTATVAARPTQEFAKAFFSGGQENELLYISMAQCDTLVDTLRGITSSSPQIDIGDV